MSEVYKKVFYKLTLYLSLFFGPDKIQMYIGLGSKECWLYVKFFTGINDPRVPSSGDWVGQIKRQRALESH